MQEANPIGTASVNSFHFLVKQGMRWPYQSLYLALLRTQFDGSAMLSANRQMLDAVEKIGRLEEAAVKDITGIVMKKMSEFEASRNSNDLGEVFDRTIKCVREFGGALIDAQVLAINLLRDNSKLKMAEKQKAVFKSYDRKDNGQQDHLGIQAHDENSFVPDAERPLAVV